MAKHWLVGDFHDDTCRLIGSPNGFLNPEDAEARKQEILGSQSKPHHVSYRIVIAANLAELEAQNILLMGYP